MSGETGRGGREGRREGEGEGRREGRREGMGGVGAQLRGGAMLGRQVNGVVAYW